MILRTCPREAKNVDRAEFQLLIRAVPVAKWNGCNDYADDGEPWGSHGGAIGEPWRAAVGLGQHDSRDWTMNINRRKSNDAFAPPLPFGSGNGSMKS